MPEPATITVALRAGGKEMMRVEDNGSGFAADDIEIAFQRHTTSKLTELEDLDRLQTLGFRGEALPSILEVADIDLVSGRQRRGPRLALPFPQRPSCRKKSRPPAAGAAPSLCSGCSPISRCAANS